MGNTPALLLLALTLHAGSLACATQPPDPVPGSVVLIGVDGLEWRIVLRLAREGRLPTITSLMQDGVYGRLETLTPTLSPAIWTSVATGKRPEKHGILHFAKPALQGEPRQLYSNGDRRTKALWNIFSEQGLSVSSVGWWMTFPVEPINGVMVAQTNTQGQLSADGPPVPLKGTILQGLEGQVFPVDFQNRVLEIAATAQAELPGFSLEVYGDVARDLPPGIRALWEQSQWSLRADLTYARVVREMLASAEQQPDLLMLYFGVTDVVAHRFWRHANPDSFTQTPAPEELRDLAGVIDDAYAWIDSAIGDVLDSYGSNTTVILVSDHGMRADNRDGDFAANPELTSGGHSGGLPGVLIVSGGHARRDETFDPQARGRRAVRYARLPTLGSVIDIAPTILALQGLPIGRDMDGAVLEDVLAPQFLQNHPLQFLATHDTEDWLRDRPTQLLSTAAEQERLEQLRALGYIR